MAEDEQDAEAFRRYSIRLTKEEIDQLHRLLRRAPDIVVMVDDGAAMRRAMLLVKQVVLWCSVIGGAVIAIKTLFFGPPT